MTIAIVTDSTSYLPADAATRSGIGVVPMTVVVAGQSLEEDQVPPERIAAALQSWQIVTTAGPNPERLLRAYRQAIADGADEIVSVHISAQMSGTYASALTAAAQASVPVHVVDSGTVGMALGFAALAGARAASAGLTAQAVVDLVTRTAHEGHEYFYVDTLEHLRRGGRISVGQALLGQALAVKPLLRIADGRVEPAERVRTASRALARLEDIAVEQAQDVAATTVDVAVHHLASSERADMLAARIADRLGSRLAAPPVVTEVGAAVGAHVGPGMLAVVVSPRL